MRWIAVCAVFAVSQVALAEELRGKVVSIADGDTITVLDAEKAQHKIRLQGIDAPEKKQAFGTKSKEMLTEKVASHEVVIAWNKKDRYPPASFAFQLEDVMVNKKSLREKLQFLRSPAAVMAQESR